MTERLTRRMLDEYDGTGIEVNGRYGINSVHLGDFETEDFYDAIAKLADLEDLQEQGRLHIVPKEFWKKIMTFLINHRCPYEFELEGLYDGCEIQSVGVCKDCWEKALKGE